MMPMQENGQPMSAHRAEAYKKLSPMGAKLFKYIEFDDDEELLAEIRKHPIGVVGISLVGILIAFIIGASTILLAVTLNSTAVDVGDSGGLIQTFLVAGGVVLALLSLGATAIAIVIYRSSVVFVTNEKIAEVAYLSIFNRKVTQLGVGNVEDVTVEQKGILAHIFDYGSIIVETAGESENCSFTMTPHPNFYSRIIIEAHEEFVHKHGN
jgi:hypothetical protein